MNKLNEPFEPEVQEKGKEAQRGVSKDLAKGAKLSFAEQLTRRVEPYLSEVVTNAAKYGIQVFDEYIDSLKDLFTKQPDIDKAKSEIKNHVNDIARYQASNVIYEVNNNSKQLNEKVDDLSARIGEVYGVCVESSTTNDKLERDLRVTQQALLTTNDELRKREERKKEEKVEEKKPTTQPQEGTATPKRSEDLDNRLDSIDRSIDELKTDIREYSAGTQHVVLHDDAEQRRRSVDRDRALKKSVNDSVKHYTAPLRWPVVTKILRVVGALLGLPVVWFLVRKFVQPFLEDFFERIGITGENGIVGRIQKAFANNFPILSKNIGKFTDAIKDVFSSISSILDKITDFVFKIMGTRWYQKNVLGGDLEKWEKYYQAHPEYLKAQYYVDTNTGNEQVNLISRNRTYDALLGKDTDASGNEVSIADIKEQAAKNVGARIKSSNPNVFEDQAPKPTFLESVVGTETVSGIKSVADVLISPSNNPLVVVGKQLGNEIKKLTGNEDNQVTTPWYQAPNEGASTPDPVPTSPFPLVPPISTPSGTQGSFSSVPSSPSTVVINNQTINTHAPAIINSNPRGPQSD